jgi:hypothetical protein
LVINFQCRWFQPGIYSISQNPALQFSHFNPPYSSPTPPVASGRLSGGKTEGFIGRCGGGLLIAIFLIVMVEVSLLLTILYGNGGGEQQRLMDLQMQTQPQAVALRRSLQALIYALNGGLA